MTKVNSNGDGTPDFLAAKREWMERYGSYIAQARNWRLAAFASLAIAAGALAGAVYEGSRTHTVPYVVEVDHLGQTVRLAEAVQAGALQQPIVRHVLANWVVDVRERITDPVAQRQIVEGTYNYVDQNAEAALGTYYHTNDPFSGQTDGDRAVTITSAIPLGTPTTKGGTYQIDWTEQQFDLQGDIVSMQNWQGIISYGVLPVTQAQQAVSNPFGIYITSFSWNKTL